MRFIAGVLKLASDRRFVERQTRWLWRCDHICLKPKSDWIPYRIFKRRILWKLIPGSHQCRARGSAHRLDVKVAQNGAVFSERMQIWRNDCFKRFWSSSRKKQVASFFSKYSSWIVPWHVIEAKIIRQNQNDIWLFARSAECLRYKKCSEKRRKQEHRRRFSLNLRDEDFRF